MTDFYPLAAGRVMEYRSRSSDSEGEATVEVLSVSSQDGRAEADCRRTTRRAGEPETSRRFSVVVEANAVRADGQLEFPLPAAVGQKWKRYPREYSIESLDGEVETPSGRYTGCLVVVYAIAGGDAGFGRRYYARGVGFVHESCADEADPFEVSLVKVAAP